MRRTGREMPPIYSHEFVVSQGTLDENGHANNVAYVQWMQNIAVLHSSDAGCTQATQAAGAIWVVRSHQVEYLHPAFLGDILSVFTWVVNFRRAMSLRRYKFIRQRDNRVLARGETNWVFVNAKTGRPVTIPEGVRKTFQLIAQDQEP
jgi:acyl-CoA thioester hydrolase